MRYTCDVLVLGGGPAGMAAAVAAASYGLRILLVEKEAFIGGRWAEYACKAGQECSSCNICLGFELMEELASESRVRVLTGSYAGEAWGAAGDFRVRLLPTSPSIDPHLCTFCGRCMESCPGKAIEVLPRCTPRGIVIRRHRCKACREGCRVCVEVCPQEAVRLGEAQEIGIVEARAIVVATGASVSEPELLPEYGWGRYAGVLTTLELERLLAAEDWSALTGRRWAFVQCAGSRSRRLGRDYCSRFCCGVSLRLLLRLYTLGLVDEAALFYMDLQLNSRRDEEVLQELQAHGLRLVRGLPGEVRKGEAGLVLRFEDLEVGRLETAEFDRVVLSVGLAPSLDNPLPGMLETRLTGGFWEQEREGVFLAGSCRGPLDIQTAVLEGRVAGEQAAQIVLRSETSSGVARFQELAADVLVWGCGYSGLRVACEALAAGCSALMLADRGNWDPADPTGLRAEELWGEIAGREGFALWEGAELIKLNGEPGNLEAWVRVAGRGVRVVKIKTVVLAPRFTSRAPVAATTQAELARDLVTGSFSLADGGGPVVFWLDANGESLPAVHALALRNLLAVREKLGAKTKIYYLARHMKVGAAPDLEALYGKLREAGVIFVKPAGPPAWDGEKLFFTDPTTSSEGRPEEVRLSPSALMVGEELSLPPEAQEFWRAVFSGGAAEAGVANLPGSVVTPRHGVFLAGAGLAPENPEVAREQVLLAARAALAVASGQACRAQSDLECTAGRREAGYCAACLTCVRTCPHGAVTVEGKALVYQKSCWGCGLCAAECPARGLEASGCITPAGLMEAFGSNGEEAVAFLCRRSAWRSLQEAKGRGLALPENIAWVPVPCAGSVDVETVLTALERGASGVMVLGCRRRACRHLYGNDRAAKRVAGLRRRLAEAGLDPRKLKFAAVGPCNPGELILEVRGFLEQLETADKAGR
ncbi:MAG: hydrogenase iron-sulfur subunit [Moorellaceae bacterium]